jgi:hypothetical protein
MALPPEPLSGFFLCLLKAQAVVARRDQRSSMARGEVGSTRRFDGISIRARNAK